jgi:hypothetical protein
MSDPWYDQPNPAGTASRVRDIMKGPGNREVIMKLVRWTVAMFTMPFIAYYGCRRFLDADATWAGVAAVVTVQVVIFGYVAAAFTEDIEADRAQEQSSSVPAVGGGSAGDDPKKTR